MDAALIQRHGYFYLSLAGADLAREGGLRTAVIVSLFTDRLAKPTDSIPDGTMDRRGHWSDTYLPDGDLEGSRLWLLDREKVLPEVLRRAEDYAKEALSWMRKDGVVSDIKATAWTTGHGDLNLRITLYRPAGDATFEFNDIWGKEIEHAF